MPFPRACRQGPNATRENPETYLAGAVREFEKVNRPTSAGCRARRPWTGFNLRTRRRTVVKAPRQLQVKFTQSPVRITGDGSIGNNRL